MLLKKLCIKVKEKLKKMLTVIYKESNISFCRSTGNALVVCYHFGVPLDTKNIPDVIWYLMNLDTSTSVGQQVNNEIIELDVSLRDMSIDRSLETCSGFWDNEYNELYGGDIQVIAKYLRIGQKFELIPKEVW
jgi:hypothetical protein